MQLSFSDSRLTGSILTTCKLLGKLIPLGSRPFAFRLQRMAKPTGETALPGDAGVVAGGPYMIELFFDEEPVVPREAFAKALERRAGRVDLAKGESVSCALLDHRVMMKDGSMPAMISLLRGGRSEAAKDPRERYASALQQTWDWPEAGDVLARCPHQMLLTDFVAGGLPRAERIGVIDAAVRAALETMPVRALAVLPSDRIVDPAGYLESTRSEAIRRLFVNVRFFNVANGATSEGVMDSLGLQIFGLPDVQCHFVGGEAPAFAGFLMGLAQYVLEKGDVIKSGDTVPGKDGDRWPCRHEESLVQPKRVVVDVRPGKHAPPGRR